MYEFPRVDRLLNKKDYEAALAGENKVVNPYLVVIAASRTCGWRIGFIISRRVGKSVDRNRIRRRLREIFRQIKPTLPENGFDCAVIVRPRAREASYSELAHKLERALVVVQRERKRVC